MRDAAFAAIVIALTPIAQAERMRFVMMRLAERANASVVPLHERDAADGLS
jgi:hypothetical protein